MSGEEKFLRLFPADAAVGDGNTVFELGEVVGEFLGPLADVAFEHQSDEVGITGGPLTDGFHPGTSLFVEVLVGIGVAAIDHDSGIELGCEQGLRGGFDAGFVVVGAGAASTENQVAPGVPLGLYDAGLAVGIDPEETVGMTGSLHGLNGDVQVAVGGIFVADGHGEATRHLAVGLGLGSPGTNGGPTDQIGGVLGGDRFEHFRGGRDPHLVDFEEESTGATEALGDIEGTVEVRIVDEPFPANGGSGLFEIDPHHDGLGFLDLIGELRDPFGVFEGGLFIMNGAGADDHQQPRIVAREDIDNLASPLNDRLIGSFRHGILRFKNSGGNEGNRSLNVNVLGRLHDGWPLGAIG